jgi:hypothetical protein
VVILVYFSPFWYFVPRKIWQPYPSAEIAKTGGRRTLVQFPEKEKFLSI